MDKMKYTEECMILLSGKQFQKLNVDAAKPAKAKIQRTP